MEGPRGGRRLRPALRGVVLAAVALAAVVLAACGDGGTTDEAVQPPLRTIAFLRAVVSTQPENQAAMLDELGLAGYVVGRNLRVLAADRTEVYPEQASAEAAVRGWAAQGVDLVVALSTTGARAVRAAVPHLTTVFLVNDPVAAGLVTNPRRPEGRLTGVTFRVPPDRTLDLARRALPAVSSFAVLYPPADPAATAIKDQAIKAAADLGISLREGVFTDGRDAATAIARAHADGARAVWALNSPTTTRFADVIHAAATARSMPLIVNAKTPGAMLTLHPDGPRLYRQMARQVARLLKGTPVREVPVENPGSFLAEVDLEVATKVGVTIPPAVVAAAHRVIR